MAASDRRIVLIQQPNRGKAFALRAGVSRATYGIVVFLDADTMFERGTLNALVAPLANPLVGAAVGAGTLLAQKLLKDPFEQLFSYDYAVSGSWTDPVVQRVGGRTAAAPAQAVAR